MIEFVCNGKKVKTDCSGGLPALDWIRSRHGLKGTKEGCREGDCGACTVVLGKPSASTVKYTAVCSCLLPMAAVHRCHLVTIEGLSAGNRLNPFQQAFYEQGASQCGFCTPGMIMSLTGFLLGDKALTVENAIESLDGNICRCTGYAAIQRAVENVMSSLPGQYENRLDMLVNRGHVPGYFKTVPELLGSINRRKQNRRGTPVAGGTDLYIHSAQEMLSLEPVFIKAPDRITEAHGLVAAGASTTVETLRNSAIFKKIFPRSDLFFSRISSTQIRSMATLGGNIMNGSPIADLAVLFLALGAEVHTEKSIIPLKSFYLGYKKFAVEKGEVLKKIVFPSPPEGSVLSALKVCKREYLDIASVNSAALLRIRKGVILEASFAAGGVYPYPLLLEKTSLFLTGKELTEAVVKTAEKTASEEISPIDDIRGSADYKRELLKSQIRAHLTRGADC